MIGFFTNDLSAASALFRHFSELESDSNEGIWSFLQHLWPKIRLEARQKFLGAILGPEEKPPPISSFPSIPLNFFKCIRDEKVPAWLPLLLKPSEKQGDNRDQAAEDQKNSLRRITPIKPKEDK